MSGAQTSFEDRLARIQKTRTVNDGGGDGAMPPASPPPTGGGRPPRKKGGGGGLALTLAFGFLILSGAAFVGLLLTSERTFVTAVTAASEAEIAGRDNGLTRMINNDAAGNFAVNLAVRRAKKRLESGDLTPEEERKTRAFIEQHEGTGVADLMRDNMRMMMAFEAETGDNSQMANEAMRELDACKSSSCVAYVNAKFMAQMQAAEGR